MSPEADAVERPHIECEARPAVLARGHKPVEEFRGGGPRVGFHGTAPAESDEGIGFFHTGTDDPARTVILETASDEMDAVGEKGRCERVPWMAGKSPAVKGEGKATASIDETAGAVPPGLHQPAASPGLSVMA